MIILVGAVAGLATIFLGHIFVGKAYVKRVQTVHLHNMKEIALGTVRITALVERSLQHENDAKATLARVEELVRRLESVTPSTEQEAREQRAQGIGLFNG